MLIHNSFFYLHSLFHLDHSAMKANYLQDANFGHKPFLTENLKLIQQSQT